jgi:hypothetical protein
MTAVPWNKTDEHSQITVYHVTTSTTPLNDKKYQKLNHTGSQTTIAHKPNGTNKQLSKSDITKRAQATEDSYMASHQNTKQTCTNLVQTIIQKELPQQFNINFNLLATQIVDLNNKFDQLMTSLQSKLTHTDRKEDKKESQSEKIIKIDTNIEVDIVPNNTKHTAPEDVQLHQHQTTALAKGATCNVAPIYQYNVIENKTKSQKEVPNLHGTTIKETSVKKRSQLEDKIQQEQMMANMESNKPTAIERPSTYEEHQYHTTYRHKYTP